MDDNAKFEAEQEKLAIERVENAQKIHECLERLNAIRAEIDVEQNLLHTITMTAPSDEIERAKGYLLAATDALSNVRDEYQAAKA